jgi:hypothetical protein
MISEQSPFVLKRALLGGAIAHEEALLELPLTPRHSGGCEGDFYLSARVLRNTGTYFDL